MRDQNYYMLIDCRNRCKIPENTRERERERERERALMSQKVQRKPLS